MKTLKLAFAMGGGVSLGSFSGAALTESIKMTLLRLVETQTGRAARSTNEDGEDVDYDRVEIDVFSGASAGSLSLAVMLRGLSWQTAAERDDAVGTLHQLYPGLRELWSDVNPELKKQLVAAQVAQDLQHKAWVQMIDLRTMLAEENEDWEKQMRYGPSLFAEQSVYSIARDLLMPKIPEGEREDLLNNRQLLSNRCLFASTLTSLTPFIHDATMAFETNEASLVGLRDALRSKVHRDLRIFDIYFEEVTRSDIRLSAEMENDEMSLFVDPSTGNKVHRFQDRWVRLHDGESVVKVAWDLRENHAWRTIAATALASGAFPAAFPPVVLERFRFEYHKEWPDSPDSLKDQYAKSRLFTYCDGGVFNNDPVREAFRMSAYLDSHRDTNEDIVRRVIFVDPSVGPEAQEMTVPALKQDSVPEAKWSNAFSPKGDSRDFSLTGVCNLLKQLLGVFVSQGRSREADGIYHTRNVFAIRERLRKRLSELTTEIDPNAEWLSSFHAEVKKEIDELLESRRRALIPSGRSTQIGEMQRVLIEEKQAQFVNQVARYYASGFNDADIAAQASTWLYIHICVLADLLLGVAGKQQDARLIAITPYAQKADSSGKQQWVPFKLLGEPFSAFAGFFDMPIREHDYQAGRFCAAGLLATETEPPIVPQQEPWKPRFGELSSAERNRARSHYTDTLEVGLQRLHGRVKQMLKDDLHDLVAHAVLAALPGSNPQDLRRIAQITADERFSAAVVDTEDEKVPSGELVFAILIPDGAKLEVDNKGFFDRDVKPRDMWLSMPFTPAAGTHTGESFFRSVKVSALVVPIYYEVNAPSSGWKGGPVKDGSFLKIGKERNFRDNWAKVELPDRTERDRLARLSQSFLAPMVCLDLRNHEERADVDEVWKIYESARPLVEKFGL